MEISKTSFSTDRRSPEKGRAGEARMVCGQETNFCRSEHISVCTAGNQQEQRGCSFYEKSSRAERCMYYIFEEYCDCLKAQLGAAGVD